MTILTVFTVTKCDYRRGHLVRAFLSLPSSPPWLCYKAIISIWYMRNDSSEKLSDLANINSALPCLPYLTQHCAPAHSKCLFLDPWCRNAVRFPFFLIQERHPVSAYLRFLHLLSEPPGRMEHTSLYLLVLTSLSYTVTELLVVPFPLRYLMWDFDKCPCFATFHAGMPFPRKKF